jgi:hypothetical protein
MVARSTRERVIKGYNSTREGGIKGIRTYIIFIFIHLVIFKRK